MKRTLPSSLASDNRIQSRTRRRAPAPTRGVRLSALLLLVLLLIPFLPACAPARTVYRSEINALTADKKGKVTLTVSLDAATLEAHKGGSLSLVCLSPAEEDAAAATAAPLDTARVGSWTSFTFPLRRGETDRLYDRYFVRFEDGTLLSATPTYLTDPTPLATAVSALPHTVQPRGLNVTETERTPGNPNADYAVALGCDKGELRIPLSSLLPGRADTHATFTDLDRHVTRGYEAGLELTLTLLVNTSLSDADAVRLFDQLAERTATGSHGGMIASLLLLTTPTVSEEAAYRLLRYATLAFRSRNAGVELYLGSEGRTLEQTEQFLERVNARVESEGSFSWGVGVVPTVTGERVWEKDDTDAVTFHNLHELAQFLTKIEGRRRRPLAVTGVRLEGGDDATLAASLVFAYRTAEAEDVRLFFWDELLGERGLLLPDGSPHVLQEVFQNLDRRHVESEYLCMRVMSEEDYRALPSSKTLRTDTVGTATLGTPTDGQEVLFDFTTGEQYGFSPVGNASMPLQHTSSAWNAPVLYTWLNPAASGVPSGIRTRLDEGFPKEGCTVLSVDLLAQLPARVTGSARLTLTGRGEGNRPLRHTAVFEGLSGSWQTVNFGVADFFAEAAEDSPVLLTLEILPDTPCDSSYVLWVRHVRTYTPTPAQSTDWTLLLLLSFSSVAVCTAALLLYRTLSRRRPRGRRDA